jgi:hypothetical protein
MRKTKFVQSASLPCYLPDNIASDIDALVKTLPLVCRTVKRKASFSEMEITPERRSEVSLISTDAKDLEGEVVLTQGIDKSFYYGENRTPVVCFAHNIDKQVGLCRWCKKTSNGLKALTYYPEKPSWYEGGDWLPDTVFAAIQTGLLQGKSIGFIPVVMRDATAQEVAKNPTWKGATIIEECKLIEYSCCVLGMNRSAIVEAVAKGIRTDLLGITLQPPKPKMNANELTALAKQYLPDNDTIMQTALANYLQRFKA